MKADLSAEYVRSRIDFDPETGALVWRERGGEDRLTRVWNTRFAGKPAGYRRKNGYIIINLLGRYYLGHRLAWLHFSGEWPADEIDHIDGDPSNNAITNLRVATRSQNQCNTGVQARVASGFKGVSRNGKHRWKAQIGVNGKTQYLGTFDTPEEAHAAFCNAAEKLHGEFARIT